MAEQLDYIDSQLADTADAAVIWCHGLGADGNDFAGIVAQLQLPDTLAIRFIFPHAPVRPITINQGKHMRGWYDITSLDIVGAQDVAGIEQSSTAIGRLCSEQIDRGIDSTRLILAGFSQGGAIALHCGLRYPKPLAGLMALSCYLPRCTDLDAAGTAPNRQVSIFMAHGLQDDVVALRYGQQSCQQLVTAGFAPLWREYPMAHNVCRQEIWDIRHWLIDRLAPAHST